MPRSIELKTLLFVLGAAIVAAGPAQAQRGPVDRLESEHVSYGVADVLRVDPVYERVEDARPREECYDEEVVRREPRGGDPTGGTVIGAIVGGALGNTVGRGDGRRAATVAGAVIGGAVGRNVDQNNGGPSREYREVRTNCREVRDVRSRRDLVGYDVEYRYRGEVYLSRIDYDPGTRLRVRIGVTPARR